MKCTRFRKHLIPYAEGTLHEQLSKPMEEHLSACESCARELQEIAQTVDALKRTEYPAMEPASDLRSRVMAQIAREPVRKPWWTGKLPAYSAAAAALLMFAVIIVTIEPHFARSRPADRSPEIVGKGPTSPESAMEFAVPTERSAMDVLEAEAEDRLAKSRAPVSAPRRPTEPAADYAKKGTSSERERLSTSYAAKGRTAAPESKEGVPAKTLSSESSASRTTGDRADVAVSSETTRVGVNKGVPPPAGPAGPRHPEPMPDGRPTVQAPYGGSQRATAESTEPPPVYFERGAGNIGPAREGTAGESDRESCDEKILMLERKLREFPTSRATLAELLKAYREAGCAEDEYAIAERLTKLDPENPQYWLARAQAAESAKMPRTAAVCYRRAIELKLTGADLELAESRLKALEEAAGR